MPRRPSSARRAPPSDYSLDSSSLIDTSRYTNPNASVSVCSDGGDVGARHLKQRLGAGRQPPPLPPRPKSACEHRAPPVSLKPDVVEHVQVMANFAMQGNSQSTRSLPRAEPVPCPPSQPRPSGARAGGRPIPHGSGETLHARLSARESSGTAAAPLATADMSPIVGEDGSQIPSECRQAAVERIVRVPATRHRQLRPTSAKATKHKRVADNHEKSIVYEDYEDSEPDTCDGVDTDTFEIEVALSEGHGPVPLLAPPKPLVALPAAAEDTKQQPPAPPAACRPVPASAESCSRDASTASWLGASWSDRAQGPSPLEPRASTPPRRPRIVTPLPCS